MTLDVFHTEPGLIGEAETRANGQVESSSGLYNPAHNPASSASSPIAQHQLQLLIALVESLARLRQLLCWPRSVRVQRVQGFVCNNNARGPLEARQYLLRYRVVTCACIHPTSGFETKALQDTYSRTAVSTICKPSAKPFLNPGPLQVARPRRCCWLTSAPGRLTSRRRRTRSASRRALETWS
jgi:hypothetical protein